MKPSVIGAGIPRTGTTSLGLALEHLLGGSAYHMSTIPGHPFDLGDDWNLALAGGKPDWTRLFEGYSAVLSWPASLFWHELSEAFPDALIVLSVRDTAEAWYRSLDATILPHARMALTPDWSQGRGLAALVERFTGTSLWDDPAVLMAAYERHNVDVRKTAPPGRLLEWHVSQGWEPLCRALDLPIPDLPFPWVSRREEWG